MGARAYKILNCYSIFLDKGQNIVEIGSERGEGSTKYFHQICQEKGYNFYTVDIDPKSYKNAYSIVGERAQLNDGKEFLIAFSGKISFAYLDNFDWDWGGDGRCDCKSKGYLQGTWLFFK